MKKTLIFLFAMSVIAAAPDAPAAVAVKKAAPVATQAAEKTAGVATLVPTVMNIVQGVQSLNAKTKELTAECIPSSAEITWVDNMMKEWAKTGAMSAKEVEKALKRQPCPGGTGYRSWAEMNAGTDIELCYDTFTGAGNDNMIWAGYPKVGSASYCPDGSSSCGNKKKNISDIYDIFNLIDFTEADYTKTDLTMATKLLTKIETCSNAKLSAKKKALWGEFLMTTIGNVGQSTNTGAIMESVGGITSGGGLQSIGAIATQFLNK